MKVKIHEFMTKKLSSKNAADLVGQIPTKQELEEGFWEIMGYTHDWSLGDLIEYSDAPLSSRKECIESMAVLF